MPLLRLLVDGRCWGLGDKGGTREKLVGSWSVFRSSLPLHRHRCAVPEFSRPGGSQRAAAARWQAHRGLARSRQQHQTWVPDQYHSTVNTDSRDWRFMMENPSIQPDGPAHNTAISPGSPCQFSISCLSKLLTRAPLAHVTEELSMSTSRMIPHATPSQPRAGFSGTSSCYGLLAH